MGEVTTYEANWTFGFFFILLAIAFSADKFRQGVKKKKSDEEKKVEQDKNFAKTSLRTLAK